MNVFASQDYVQDFEKNVLKLSTRPDQPTHNFYGVKIKEGEHVVRPNQIENTSYREPSFDVLDGYDRVLKHSF